MIYICTGNSAIKAEVRAFIIWMVDLGMDLGMDLVRIAQLSEIRPSSIELNSEHP